MKKAFSLLEVLLSIFLLSILVIVSIKAFTHIKQISQKDTLRYLALNKIDNEMSRLVYAYENINSSEFTQYNYDFDTINKPLDTTIKTLTTTSQPFYTTGTHESESQSYDVYKLNPLSKPFGLLIDTQNNLNVIELKNSNSGDINEVNEGDTVGLLSFRTDKYSIGDDFADISLSITYPYIVTFNGTKFEYKKLWDEVETINLKTTTETL